MSISTLYVCIYKMCINVHVCGFYSTYNCFLALTHLIYDFLQLVKHFSFALAK